MTPITRQDILAHQAVVPWVAQYQVEQDLLLCRAMVALFDDKFLDSQIAMRGGTLLHKVHLAPPTSKASTFTKCWARKCARCFSGRAGGICSICIGHSPNRQQQLTRRQSSHRLNIT